MQLKDERQEELLAARHRRADELGSGRRSYQKVGPLNGIHLLHELMYCNNVPEEEFFNLLNENSVSHRTSEPQFRGKLVQKKSSKYGWMKGRVLRQYVRKSGKGKCLMHCQILYEDGNREDISVHEIKRRQGSCTFEFLADSDSSLNQSVSVPVIKHELHRSFPSKATHFVHKPIRRKAWRSSSPLQKPERSSSPTGQFATIDKAEAITHKASAHRAGFVNMGVLGRREMRCKPDKLSNEGHQGRPWRQKHAFPNPKHWAGSAVPSDLIINEHGQVRHANSGFVHNAKFASGKLIQPETHHDFHKDARPPSLLVKRTPTNSSVNRTSVRVSEVASKSSSSLHHPSGYRYKYPLMEFKKETRMSSSTLPLAQMNTTHRRKFATSPPMGKPSTAWG